MGIAGSKSCDQQHEVQQTAESRWHTSGVSPENNSALKSVLMIWVAGLCRKGPGNPGGQQVESEPAVCLTYKTGLTKVQREGQEKSLFPSIQHTWDQIWRTMSSFGLPHTRKTFTVSRPKKDNQDGKGAGPHGI